MTTNDIASLMDHTRLGDRRALAKVISVLENMNTSAGDRDYIIDKLFAKETTARFIGISGTPGVGKSTLIQAYGKYLVEKGRKVAVLAVDPSSPVGGGSILGDKTRMAEIAVHENVFVRPSPSMGFLGGLTAQTYLTQLLCAYAGYEHILVETVGVGQSEVEAAEIVDLFIVLCLPNSGDELQGIKKGILEIADIVAINKADGELLSAAERAKMELENAFQITRSMGVKEKVFITLSAAKNKGIDKLHETIESRYHARAGDLKAKRLNQKKAWFRKELESRLMKILRQKSSYQRFIQTPIAEISKGQSIQSFVDQYAKKLIKSED